MEICKAIVFLLQTLITQYLIPYCCCLNSFYYLFISSCKDSHLLVISTDCLESPARWKKLGTNNNGKLLTCNLNLSGFLLFSHPATFSTAFCFELSHLDWKMPVWKVTDEMVGRITAQIFSVFHYSLPPCFLVDSAITLIFWNFP